MKLLSKLLILCFCVFHADGLNIFGVFPLGSKSHFAIGKSIANALHDAGHNITVMSPFPEKQPRERYRDIDLTEVKEKYEKENQVNGLDLYKMPIFMILLFMANMGRAAEPVFQYPKVQEFLNSGEKFDVCIVEIFYLDVYLSLSEHFGCVLVGYTTFNAVGLVDEMTGNISPSSYVPMPFLDHTDKMTFVERLWNAVYANFEKILFHTIQLPLHRRLQQKYLPNVKKPLDEIYKSAAIIFQNSHVSFSTPRPYLPNVVEICGIHVKPAKPLPTDLQKFLDDAHEGVILFSMGSFINSKDFPVDKRNAFVNAFRKLKQKVIWKYEEKLPDRPANVRTEAWLPQRDILAHKNVVLFITHGGLLGTTEAMVEGKALLGIPIFGDQSMNMLKAVSKGYGLMIGYSEITEEKVTQALNAILNDKKYQETAKLISSRFNDRPMSPKESVVYWTEYAYRHKGAKHLRATATELSFIQLKSIDVYAVLLLIFAVSCAVNYYLAKFVLRKIVRRFTKKQKKN